ncbi:MAG: glycolate oxidase subunit GlcE, partial [Gammaproteobacteria bacterium]
AEDPTVWAAWRDFTHPVLRSARAPWRISAPPAAPMPDAKFRSLWDWGGALRWVDADLPDAQMEARAAAAGGFAQRWPPVIRPVPVAALADLEHRVRCAFDAAEICNPQ